MPFLETGILSPDVELPPQGSGGSPGTISAADQSFVRGWVGSWEARHFGAGTELIISQVSMSSPDPTGRITWRKQDLIHFSPFYCW